MTRINVVPVSELCDQHLLAEHRELTRIPNDIVKRQGLLPLSTLSAYTLGTGHVTFFRDKLLWLSRRYEQLHQACLQRGFAVSDRWPTEVNQYSHLWLDYQVTELDLQLNRQRIAERMPSHPRFTMS